MCKRIIRLLNTIWLIPLVVVILIVSSVTVVPVMIVSDAYKNKEW